MSEVYLVRAVTLGSISFFAISGNLLVISAILSHKRLRTSTNVFVANLALSNVTTGLLLIFMTWNAFENRNMLGTAGCKAWGFLGGTALLCSTFTMALISLSRCVLISQPSRYRVLFTTGRSVLGCSCAWLLAFLVMVGTVAGWSGVRYNPRTKACSYSRNIAISFHYFSIALGFGVPLVTVVVCYSLLYYAVLRSKKRIQTVVVISRTDDGEADKPPASVPAKDSQPKRDIKITKMLLTIFLVYVTSLGPYSVVNLADTDGYRFPEVVHLLVTWFLFANAAVNPFIYGFMNKTFREGYRLVLCKNCSETPREDPGKSVLG